MEPNPSAVSRIARKGLIYLVVALGFVFLAALLAIAGNTISLRQRSQNEFRSHLDTAIFLSTEWVREHQRSILTTPNTPLFYMLSDIAAMSDNPVATRLIRAFLEQDDDHIWRRLVDPGRPAALPTREFLDGLQDYQYWTTHAIDPLGVTLPRGERDRMFDPAMHHSGSLTHQLFALKIYRDFQGASTDLDHLIDHLCERVAFEALFDFRVSDIYLQRVAFLLACNRPDLVRRRWVERIIANQKDDGGWTYPWYLWGPAPLRIHKKVPPSTEHPTIQAMWALYQIRYRYPDWITTHYSE